MKILICLTLAALALGSTAMVELSGFKTADQLLNDLQSDPENVYGIIFFKRDDTDFDLTKSNKKILEKTKAAADELAKKITDEKIKYLYFARVDASVEENKGLYEKFGFKADSFDKYPAGAVTRNAAGHKFKGPAVASIFEEKVMKAAGIEEEEKKEEEPPQQ
jgi:hypothetical protein